MQHEEPYGNFTQVFGRGLIVLALLFIGGFTLIYWGGVLRFFEWLGARLGEAPAALERLVTYYGALAGDALLASLLVGVLVGGLSSAFAAFVLRSGLGFPPLGGQAWGAAFAGVLLALVGLRADLWTALLLGLVVLVVVGWWRSPELHAWVSDARRVHVPGLGWFMLALAGQGALLGLLGGQLFAASTQHCTYAAEMPRTQVDAGLLGTGLLALVMVVPLWALNSQRRRNESTAGFFRSRGLPLLFLAPMLLNLMVFLYYPSLQTLLLSLNSRRFPLPQERFVCLENYTRLAEDVIYQNSFVTTFALTAAIVFISLGLALGIGVLASQKIRYVSVYRTLLIWPFALSPVVAGAIFLTMFREGETGLINAALKFFTGTTLNWLRDPGLAQASVVLASVWNILGFNILFYVAGLQNVPQELLEAAQIDGANRWQRFVRVTFPMLAPYTFFLLVTNVTYSFYGIYGAVDTLTQGGPPLGAAGSLGGATDVLIYKLYEDAFNPGSPVGLAAAQALILFVMVAGITLLQFRAIESRITYGE